MAAPTTEHRVTELQAKALGITPAQVDDDPVNGPDYQGAYEEHFLYGGAARFSKDGDLIVPSEENGEWPRIITPDGVDVGEAAKAVLAATVPEEPPGSPEEAKGRAPLRDDGPSCRRARSDLPRFSAGQRRAREIGDEKRLRVPDHPARRNTAFPQGRV